MFAGSYPIVQWRLVHITDTILSSSLPEYTPSLAALFHLRILAAAQISPPPVSPHHVNRLGAVSPRCQAGLQVRRPAELRLLSGGPVANSVVHAAIRGGNLQHVVGGRLAAPLVELQQDDGRTAAGPRSDSVKSWPRFFFSE